MKPGSVIVDMAAANGGNVEGTVPDERVVTDNGVTIIGYTDLAGRLPAQASQLYGTNLVNLLKLLTPEKDGQARPRLRRRGPARHDRGRATARSPGRRRRSQVSAAPAAAAAAAAGSRRRAKQPHDRRRAAAALVGAGARRCSCCSRRLAGAAPRPLHGVRARGRHRLLRHRQRAPRAAHAADVGDQRDLRHHRRRRAAADRRTATSCVIGRWPSSAILLASINIFGGFAVTRRMLAMFPKELTR